MDSRITIGDKLEIEKIETRLSADPSRKPVVYSSQVLDETDEGNLLVSMPCIGERVVPLSVGQEFFATFYSKGSLFRCRVIVRGRYKKGSLFLMEIEQLTILQKIQRREFFRFEKKMPLEYRVLTDDDKLLVSVGETPKESPEESEWKNGIVLDLSGGGIRFVSPFKEQPDSFVQVRFTITDMDDRSEIVYSYGEILRSEQNPNNSSIYDNRLMFYQMNAKLREKIIKFIFDEQRRNMSRD